MSYTGSTLSVLRSLVEASRSEQVTFLAASLAYYTFVSIMPLLLLVVAVGTALGGEEVAAAVVEQLGPVLSAGGEELLLETLTSQQGRGEATVFGVAVLVWGSLKLFRGLDVAFAQIYEAEKPASLLDQFRDAAAALVGVGGGIAISFVASALVGLSGVPVADVFGPPAIAVALTVSFLPLYVILPNPDVGVREALPGAVLAGGGWTLLGIGFRVYAERAVAFKLYGVISGVLLLVTWFYVAGIVLLLGGVLNVVLADRSSGDEVNRQLQQEPLRREAQRASMTDEQGGTPDPDGDAGADDGRDRDEELAELRERLAEFEDEIDDRTVHRDEVEADLKKYVRRRVRRGHARGWGPYLVLLYGTAMTLGAFYFLSGGWAILAMLVVWLSTLGLYVLMLIVGVTFTVAGLPGRLRDVVGKLRP